MDAGSAFLHRHEQRAVERRRRGEPLRVTAAVMQGDVPGLLAVTPTRILHAWRAPMRTRVTQWRRRDVAGIRIERSRHGRLLLILRNGGHVRFEFTSRADAEAVETAVLPRPAPSMRAGAGAPTGAPVEFLITRPTRTPAADPLAHRGTHQHTARLRQLHAKGVLTKAELDWQLAA